MATAHEIADVSPPGWPVELIDDFDLARALKTSVQRVRQSVRKGELPKPAFTDGRRWKWSKARLISHLTGEIPPKAEG